MFTPNGDDKNEVFTMGDDISIIHLLIYDRWGRKVFESDEQTKAWNGKNHSTEMNEGTYYYVADVIDCSAKPLSIRGTVYLKR